MKHAGESGGKEVPMSLGLCVYETKGDDCVSLGVRWEHVRRKVKEEIEFVNKVGAHLLQHMPVGPASAAASFTFRVGESYERRLILIE